MNKIIIKNLFFAFFLVVGLWVVFSPHTAKASYINFSVKAYKVNSNGTKDPLDNFSVTMTGSSNAGKFWGSVGNCKPCGGETATVTTNSSGVGGPSGDIACGFSDCGTKDTGTCNPFTFSWSVGSPGKYDPALSYVSSPWGVFYGASHTETADDYTAKNTKDPTWEFYWYPRYDYLDISLSHTTSSNNKMDCIDNSTDPNDDDGIDVIFKPKVDKHDTNLGDSLSPWYLDVTNNGSIEATSSSDSISYRYKMKDLSAAQRNTLMTTGSLVVKARVTKNCNAPGVNSKNAYTNVTLLRSDRRLVCVSIDGVPKSGNVPLTVTFTGALQENWCTANADDYRFGWDFLGNGFDKASLQEDDRITRTTGNNANGEFTSVTAYTYILENVNGFNANLYGWIESNPDLPPVSCPSSFIVNSQFFSDTNYQEVAP